MISKNILTITCLSFKVDQKENIILEEAIMKIELSHELHENTISNLSQAMLLEISQNSYRKIRDIICNIFDIGMKYIPLLFQANA